MNSFNPINALYLLIALLDYTVKAVLNFKETEEGHAEWLDVEARAAAFLGDDVEAAEIKTDATASRQASRASSGVQSRTLEKIDLTK